MNLELLNLFVFRNLSEPLREILVELEEDICYEYDQKNYAEKISNLIAIYKVFLWIICRL